MSGVISTVSSRLSILEFYNILYGVQGSYYSLDAIRNQNPFLQLSTVYESATNVVTVFEPFNDVLQDNVPSDVKLNFSHRPEQNRSSYIVTSSAATMRTDNQFHNSNFTESSARTYVESLVTSFSTAIYNCINKRCYEAMNGTVSITDVIVPGNRLKDIPAEEDGVETIDATATGFTTSVANSIRQIFFRNTQNNFVNSDDYYLVLPEAAKSKFFESAGAIQAIQYTDDLRKTNKIEMIRGVPVFSPKGNFFKVSDVTIKGTTKKAVLGYAVLRNGLTLGYQAPYTGGEGFINESGLVVSPERAASIQNLMFMIRLKKAGPEYLNGFIVSVEGNVGAVRSFTGAVVRIALPVDNI